MISIAEKIIQQQEEPFDPSQFTDRYEEALKALIADKRKGHKVAKVAEPDDTNVVDLMAALRASLGGAPSAKAKPAKTAAKATARSKATAAPAPAKTPARRKAG
jgi:DNA end-binding protein Ku